MWACIICSKLQVSMKVDITTESGFDPVSSVVAAVMSRYIELFSAQDDKRQVHVV